VASDEERLEPLANPDWPDDDDIHRILTVPNVISLLRLVILVPLFVVVLLVLHSPGWALGVAIFLGATDFLDGYIARRFNQVTNFGKGLDPIADRVAQIIMSAALVVGGYLPIWMAVVVLVSDLTLGFFLLFRGRRPIPVRWIGRIRTALLLVGLPLVLLMAAVAPANLVLKFVAIAIVGVGVVLNTFADLIYILSLYRGTAHLVKDAHPVRD
jgi:cardiolipin synthase (CMP-forming)